VIGSGKIRLVGDDDDDTSSESDYHRVPVPGKKAEIKDKNDPQRRLTKLMQGSQNLQGGLQSMIMSTMGKFLQSSLTKKANTVESAKKKDMLFNKLADDSIPSIMSEGSWI
jgi:hypothetical protein